MAKNIVLFSDGTGNSSGKLLRTNVWRMYEAVDLGPAPKGKREQIAYYDDGVGNSAFKPLAMLGGIFGIGLKRNVLDIYRYACRNYHEGDQIYGFGFSRGAFTMRLVIALIADQGLVKYEGERDLKRQAKRVWRDFCALNQPRYAFSPIALLSRARRAITRLLRKLSGDKEQVGERHQPDLRFVGVWDTVAAYGGPIAEITRAVDNWIYRVTMPNYELNNFVQTARHALALDDERDSFHPLLWDEVHEGEMIQAKKDGEDLPDWINEDRLQQVWFTGMHADVGGGYPDESLSYVSLLWMIEEAQKADLRTVPVITERYVALANSFGPIHDSRAGVGAYYRYQPRNISAWIDPVDKSTLSLRDPAIKTKQGRSKGLLTSVKIHESVIARIEAGTDRYAPIVLPTHFSIVPPGLVAENQPQPTSDDPTTPLAKRKRTPMITDKARSVLGDRDNTTAMAEAMQKVWNRVWWRRGTYFATLFATLLLLTMPMWISLAPEPPILSDGRNWIGSLILLLSYLVPGFLSGLIQTFAANALYFLCLIALIIVLWLTGNQLQMRMRDRARRIWSDILFPSSGTTVAAAQPSMFQAMRTSAGYQRAIQVTKWYVLPNVIAILMGLLTIWAVLGLVTQIRLPWLELSGALCPREVNSAPRLEVISRDFDTRSTCKPMHISVEKGQRYEVAFHVVEPWADGVNPTNPEGLSASDMRWGVGYLGTVLRRVVGARYLQPVYEIRPPASGVSTFDNVYLYPLGLKRESEGSNVYRGEFIARRSGNLHLFANDAVLPFTSDFWGQYNLGYFYGGAGPFGEKRLNRGTACVTIAKAGDSGDQGIRADEPVCKQAAERVANLQALRLKRDRLRAAGQNFIVE